MSKNKFSKRLAASLIAAATIGSSGVLSSLTYLPVHAADTDNYAKLLQYSMYFYDGNMCGDDVDSASAFDWRGDCHTGDEVVGGFHDAGDHVKFGLPAGYSAATLGWGYYEFKDAYDSLGQTAHLKEITNRFCKYFKDCTVLSGDTVSKFCYQIGEGGGGNDHGYWGPPETQESIKGSRKAFWTSNGASDIAAEYAAALAVNYLNFGNAEDLKYAEALYKFSTQYNQCATDGTNGFYTSDTYEDDQAWAAGFLYLATKDDKYKNFMDNFFATGNRQWGEVYTPLGWSNAESGAAALYGEIAGDWKWANSYVSKNCTDKSTFWMPSWASWGSARTNTAMQLVAMVISKHTDNDYSDWCKAQMGMILGDNSTGKNLVVGFNENSPKYPHHRAASGHAYTSSDEATPAWDEANSHVLVGALVGGPSSSDFSTYKDTINDARLNEVALDYNAAFVGAAAALYDKYKTGSLESNIPGVGATPTTTAATTTTTGKTTTTAAVTTTKAAETTKAPTTVAQGDGCYTKKVNQDVVYKELPAADKMLGWSYEDLGVKAGEKVQKVEIDISTTADKIGKWQGAFGSSTTVDPDYWTQTEDMQQVIDGDSGTLVWNVDSATSDIIQTQYGGQVKVGFWWIDCNEFTIDEVRVYTDKSSSNPTTTAAVTTTKTNPTTTASSSTGNGAYEIKPGQDVVYKDLPAADKMLGWTYEELGVKAGEKVQKVEIDISTTADKIGKWQGAFGSSTTVDPDYWTQTEDMQQVIDGDSGTLVWNVDSATSDIIQTQYGGQVKVGFWWIDCNEFTIDAVRVYTDKSSTNPTTTAAVTTATTKATTKATTTTTKAATTTAAPSTTAAPTTTTKLVVGNEPTMAVNNGQKIFATPGQEYAEIPLNLYNVPDTEGITVAFKTDAEGTPTLALLKDAYQLYEAADAFVNLGKWEANPKGLSWGVPSSGKQMVKGSDFVNGDVFLSLYYNIPDEATVKKIAEANGLEPKQDAEHGTYYEFPLVFEREKLNNKDGKLLDWVGTNNTKISATYVDGSICIPVTGVKPTTTTAVTTTTPAGSTATTTKTELTVNGPTMAVNKGEDVVVTPGQEYAEIPLNLYNVPDTEGITVAFKTDAEGTPTLALLKDAYQLYEAADAFVNLGKWEANPKGLSWGVPSSGKQMVKSGDFADGDVFLSLYYNIPDEATVKDIAEANGLELKHNAEYGAYYEFPLVFEREKLNNKDGKLLDWVGTNNTKVNATYIDSNLIVKVSDTGETTTTATTTSGGETTTTEVVTTASSAPVTTSPDATTTTTSVSYNGESFEWVLGKYKADGSYEPRTFVKAGQKSASAVAPKVYGDPGINSANIRLEGDAAKALLAAGTYVGLTKNADYDTQLAGEGGTTWLDNAAQLRFAFASNDVNNTNNAKTADGSAIGELVYDIPDAETVKSIADQYGISLVTGTDDEGNEVSYYEFPLTWSEAVGEHGETATQCGSYVDGALVEIPYDQYTRRDGTICVVVPSETTTTAATTTTAEVTTTTEAVTTAAVDTTTEVPATTTTAAATTTTEAATTTTEAATTTTEAATTTTEAATTTTEAATTTTEAVTTTTEAATTTTEAATTTTEAVTTTTEAATTTTEAATTTTEAATTTTEAATTTTEAATTTTTTEATTTSTTEATTTTSATTTQPQPNVTTIVFELADPNFYFSVDEREFKATDLFKSVTLISTDADGKIVSQEDIIDKVNFNGATPKSTYVQADKYYAGTIQAYYNNGTENVLIPDATPTVYIGVKGDADLNGLEDVPDAVAILTYYAKIAAGQQGIVFNEDPMLNKLAYFLADVDTESKAGENTDGKLMEVNDAVYVLTYYAKKAAGQGPTWPDVIPSLKSLEGSMWYEG